MDKHNIICVICPSSCQIQLQAQGRKITGIEGNACKLGDEYARTEFLEPKRTLATTVKANGYKSPIISVRSSGPIPKDLMFDCMEELKKCEVNQPFSMGRVVIENILDTEIDIILTNE